MWCSDADVPRSSSNAASAVFFLLRSHRMLPCIRKDTHGGFKFITFLSSNPRGKEPPFQIAQGRGKEAHETVSVAWDYRDLNQA